MILLNVTIIGEIGKKILNNLKLKKIFLRYRTYYQLLKSNVIGTNKTRNEPFESMKKHFFCQDLLKPWMNQNVEKHLKFLKQENYR